MVELFRDGEWVDVIVDECVLSVLFYLVHSPKPYFPQSQLFTKAPIWETLSDDVRALSRRLKQYTAYSQMTFMHFVGAR